jgi:hypothetical protein
MLTGWHSRKATMKYIALITALLLSATAHAKPVEKYGIIAVPEIWADKLADCEYLGIVDSSSWYDSLSNKGAEKKFYKNMNKLGATHFMVSGDGLGKDNMASQMWVPKGTYRKYNQSAQAFRCEDATDTDQKKVNKANTENLT